MDKFGFRNQSNINFVCSKVMKYMVSNPKMKEALLELYEFNESRKHDDDLEDTTYTTRTLLEIDFDDM
jgi:hypothetical protein